MESPIPENSTARALLDAIPMPVFLADRDVRLVEANLAARRWLRSEDALELQRLGGDVLRCVFALDSAGGCGTTEACPTCVIRESVESAAPGQAPRHRVAHAILETAEGVEDRWFRVGATPVTLDGRDLVLLTLEDATRHVELREVLPLCPGCGKTPREPAAVLREAQAYLQRHPGVWSVQELCPDCQRTRPPVPWNEGVL